jgi:hypothetical protein
MRRDPERDTPQHDHVAVREITQPLSVPDSSDTMITHILQQYIGADCLF